MPDRGRWFWRDQRIRPLRLVRHLRHVWPVPPVPPGGTTHDRSPGLTGPRGHPTGFSRCSCLVAAHQANATDVPIARSPIVPWAATRRRSQLSTAVLVTAVALAACGTPTPVPTAVLSALPGDRVSPPAVPNDSQPSPSSPLDATPPGSGAAVGVDGSLLDILPATVEGAVMTPDAETAAGIAADVSLDPSLAADLDALAVALYAGRDDYAVVTITRLRQGLFGEAYFRDWRDSFDEAVCAQSGGVDGHAEASIGGRTTYIGTCAGGVRTYHVRLSGPDRIVSLQALGEGRYGEQILAGLTE